MLLGFASAAQAACDWPLVNHDQQNTRYNPCETILNTSTVNGLVYQRQFVSPNGIQIAPVIVNEILYTGDVSGNFYAIDANNFANILWQIALPGPVDAPPSVVDGTVYLTTGTGSVQLYALDALTGAVRPGFPVAVDPGIPAGRSDVLAGPVVVENIVIVPLCDGGSFGVDPAPTIHQTINAFDATTGAFLWRRVVQPLPYGPQGGSFSTASVDTDLHYLFIGTSNNDNEPVGKFSDALVALDYRTGKLQWSYQFTEGDAWGPLYPNDPDWDVGASPNLFTIRKHGKDIDVVGVSSKRGIYRVFERKSGKKVWKSDTLPEGFVPVATTAPGAAFDPELNLIYVPMLILDEATAAVSPPGALTILQANGNSAASAILFNINFNIQKFQITALDADSGKIKWQTAIPGVGSGSVTAANGVVYFDNWRGEIYALSGKSGNIHWSNTTHFSLPTFLGGPITVHNGQLFVPSGINLGVPVPGTVTVFGLP